MEFFKVLNGFLESERQKRDNNNKTKRNGRRTEVGRGEDRERDRLVTGKVERRPVGSKLFIRRIVMQ
jgi:hypothetical protein